MIWRVLSTRLTQSEVQRNICSGSCCFNSHRGQRFSQYLHHHLSHAGESKGEPAIEENLQEKASGTETTEPFIVDNPDDDMTTVTAFGVSWMFFFPLGRHYNKTNVRHAIMYKHDIEESFLMAAIFH